MSDRPEPPKIEMVKVWVATSKIPAGTEITKELIAKSLKEKEMPREYAVGAYSDLTECINQGLTLKTDLVTDAVDHGVERRAVHQGCRRKSPSRLRRSDR